MNLPENTTIHNGQVALIAETLSNCLGRTEEDRLKLFFLISNEICKVCLAEWS